MRKNGKLLAALMCLLLLCALCLPALAEQVQNVKYIEYKWDGKKLTGEEKTCAATKLTGSETKLSEEWYVAAENVTFSRRPEVSGHVHLILADGCKVTAQEGIGVECVENSGENSLSIYAQSEGEDMGMLEATSKQQQRAAIGGDNFSSNRENLITIHGGAVTANASDADAPHWGAAIGSGTRGHCTVTI